MTTEDQNPEGADLSQANGKEDTGSQDQGTDEQKDYRAKLNATNRFLEKEGYEFRDGGWHRKPEAKKPETSPEPKNSDPALSDMDMLAIMQSQVHIDDVPELKKAAKLLGKSIPEALKDDTVQAILKRRTEHRKTADASNTRTARSSVKAPSGEELLKDLSQGKVPDPGSKEADDLFWARRGGKRN